MPPPGEERRAWRTYLIAQLPGWLFVVVGVALLHRLAGLPAWAAILLLLLWIGKTRLGFSRVKQYYTPEPAPGRIIGESGVAVTALTPTGTVRVNGELWQATSSDPAARIPEGAGIRVREIRKLELRVDRDDTDPSRLI